jgi:hypothetical protein
MEVIITEWGLQSYIDAKARGVFSVTDYRTILKPDVLLLKTEDPFATSYSRFCNGKFWGPAKFNGVSIKFGHKMKWHNFGIAKVQFRLCVVIVETNLNNNFEQRAFLCNAYIKDDKTDKSEMARLKIKIQKIIDGTFIYRGNL